jgi:hypothetical protein
MTIYTALVKVLNAEILWHQKNPGGSCCGPSFESGFICGLKQARRLVRKALKAQKKRKRKEKKIAKP